MPNDADSVCDIPIYIGPTGNYQTVGYHIGDTVPDFTLYQMDSTPFTLSNTMADGKPVLLVSASYTCYAYRRRLQDLNDIYAAYGNDVNVYIVYTLEAHPTDTNNF